MEITAPVGAENRSQPSVLPSYDAALAPIDAQLADLTPTLLVAARYMTRTEGEAWDLVQSVLEIALRRAGELRNPLNLRAWLLKIEAREAGRIRRRIRTLTVPLPADIVGETAAVDETLIALRVAVHKLPNRARTAVVLHHMLGMSVSETADAMNVSQNTVKSELKTALEHLREAMRD